MRANLILTLLLSGFFGLTQNASAQSGTFVATGQMNSARFSHTATLLRDGKVLIAGGSNFNGGNFPLTILASTEIYDPSTRTFTSAGSMTFPRLDHTAILLKDGRVLIAGGEGRELTAELTAEIYDPSTGAFQPTGNMIRRGSAVTLLDNGKVLLADDTGKFQLYDPSTGVFEDAGQFEGDIIGAAATPLADGRILAVGQKSDSTANVTFIYDPAARTFSHTGNLIQYPVPSGYFAALSYFTLTPLANGGVLLAGGCYPEIYTVGSCWEADTAEFYDPATQAFTDTGHLTQAPSGGSATMLLGGTVLIAGGSTASGELYDPSTGTFAGIGRMTAPRDSHTATLLADGTVLIAGGFDTSRNGPVFNSAELYVPAWWPSPAPGIGGDKASLSFVTDLGQQTTQAVAVSNTGGGDLEWSAVTTAPWLSATPANGKNSGAVSVTASAAGLQAGTYNASLTILTAAPTAPVIIPVTFTVCSYAMNPGGQAFSVAGGAGTISISAGSGCQWSISDSSNWITLGSATGGTGNGTVSFQVMPNSSVARSGTLSIAGLGFSVEQQSALITGLSLAGSIAHLAAGGDWNTTVTLINTGANAATARLSFFDDNGKPLALPLAFPQVSSSSGPLLAATLDRTLAPNATLVIDTAGLKTDPAQTGSVQLFTDGNVGAFNLYRWNFNNQEAMAPLEIRNAGAYVLAFDNTNGLLNGGAIANLTAQALSVPVVIRDDTGAVIQSTSISLAGEGHTSFLLSLLFTYTANKRGTIEFDTPPGGRISVAGLRFSTSGTVTAIPVLGDSAAGSGSFAQIAVGADWNTTITLINTGANAGHARLSFFGDNGSPLALPLAFPQEPSFPALPAATLDRTLAPNATLVIDTAGLKTDPAQTGSVQLSTDGSVGAFNLYRWNFNNQEALAPLEIRNADAYLFPFDNTNGLVIGGAIANLSAHAVIIPVMIRDDTGALTGSGSVSLAGEGHTSFVLSALFAETANKRGTIEFDTPPGGQISVTGLRFTPSGAFTAIPVLVK